MTYKGDILVFLSECRKIGLFASITPRTNFYYEKLLEEDNRKIGYVFVDLKGIFNDLGVMTERISLSFGGRGRENPDQWDAEATLIGQLVVNIAKNNNLAVKWSREPHFAITINQ